MKFIRLYIYPFLGQMFSVDSILWRRYYRWEKYRERFPGTANPYNFMLEG